MNSVLVGYLLVTVSGTQAVKVNETIYPTLKECVTQSLWPTDEPTTKRECYRMSATPVNYQIIEKPNGSEIPYRP